MGTQARLGGGQGREGFHKQRSDSDPEEGETGKGAAACSKIGTCRWHMSV